MNASAPNRLAVIDVPDRCGNAPRKAVIRDFIIDLYGGRIEQALELLTEDVHWDQFGFRTLRGIDEVRGWLEDERSPRELKLKTVITHGTDCGVDGKILYGDGTSEAFCHVLLFTGGSKTARIKEIRTYAVRPQ